MKRGRIPHDASERSSVPLVVAIAGLLAAVASFWVKDQNFSATLCGSGLITAAWCILYWLASPAGRDD